MVSLRSSLPIVILAGCGRIGFDPTDDLAALANFNQIDVANEASCGVFRGRGYCWGANDVGQLGVGDQNDRAVPTEVALPPGTVTQIDIGTNHGCAILDDSAWCWGIVALGRGGAAIPMSPMQVTALPSPVTQISAGYDFSCAIAAGDVYCWGDDTEGRLGNGPAGSSALPIFVLAGVRQVHCGGDHACAVKTDGTTWCWGHNDSGALGQGTNVVYSDLPGQVVDRTAFTKVSMGGYTACGISAGGAWCWGTGDSGELGNGAASSSNRPVLVSGLVDGVQGLDTGGGPSTADGSCAVRSGALWCWGNGSFGRLGNRSTTNLPVPAEVTGLPAAARAVAIGWVHTCAIIGDGEVMCWGNGTRGQLGDGVRTTSLLPVRVQLPAN